MKILDLPLKAKWYEMIESGEKPEEYRANKPYWCKRLLGYVRASVLGYTHVRYLSVNLKGYTHVRFRYGYTKRTMMFEIDDIRMGFGNPAWGAPEDEIVFIIKLGKRKE